MSRRSTTPIPTSDKDTKGNKVKENLPQDKLIELEASKIDLNQLTKEAQKQDLANIAPTVGSLPLDNEVVQRVIARLAHQCYLPPLHAFIAIALLFLKGAASKTAPDKMFVEVYAIDGSLIKVFKGELMQVLQATTGNRFLRRLAETLAIPICQFAENNKLIGDLAFNFDIEEVSEGKEPLTPKEKAWSNSFCQYVPNLEEHASPRVKQLLGLDYQKRFEKKKKKKVKEDRLPQVDANKVKEKEKKIK